MLRRTCVVASGGICGSRSEFLCVRSTKHRRPIFMLGWSRCGFHKKHTGTSYAELVFLHSVGSACHAVHSGASGPRNINALFFMLRWNRYGFNKKHAGTRYSELVFLYPMGYAGHVIHFSASGAWNDDALFLGGPGVVSIKRASGHIMLNFCFFIRWDQWDM
jgi:hypothetical protein